VTLEGLVMPDFDAIIIGTGQAGPSLAFRLAGVGMKVAVVERHLVGGTCVNTGCTPTKALVASAYAARSPVDWSCSARCAFTRRSASYYRLS
jgi:pyruvate/2-oxoglutarate dehydrogenase complex dihydrolipoamide dehydrogenase (E3) component